MDDDLKRFSVAISKQAHSAMRAACKAHGLTTNELLETVLVAPELEAIAEAGARRRKLDENFTGILSSAQELTDEQRAELIKRLAEHKA